MHYTSRTLAIMLALMAATGTAWAVLPDTGQSTCYDTSGEMRCPAPGDAYFGQDAQYSGAQPSYRDNGDGTVSDLVTGLMWSKAVDATKVSPEEAVALARTLRLGGHADWRVPTVTELFSLIDFRGYTGFEQPAPGMGQRGDGAGGGGAPGQVDYNTLPGNAVPFIDTDYFGFRYGDTSASERYIDAQWVTTSLYRGYTMGRMETMFGVNFADGRIKGYGYRHAGGGPVTKRFYARFVRGAATGPGPWIDQGDGTVLDQATGLVWQQADAGEMLSWREALAYCEGLSHAGQDDWRLPNAKELQALVDYQRGPESTGTAAIDPAFTVTPIRNEAGAADFPFYWTSTTHLDGPRPGTHAVYVAFGRAIGQMRGEVMDVHGAGAQRSDPKTGSPAIGKGPQGDAQRIENAVRCVRAGGVVLASAPVTPADRYPDNVNPRDFAAAPSFRDTPPVAAPSQARPTQGGGPAQGGRFVERLDRDGDGRVSRAEFDGPAQMFSRHDSNGDGFLSADEAPPPPR